MTMLRYLGLLALPLLLLSSPASAVTAKDKMETCKFGAQSENLTGAKANAFIKRCMAKGNYEPAARKAMTKSKKPTKKPAAKKPMAAGPADKKQ
jgi:hypothetical protein